ncbi:MAG TPA: anti-sigma factor [Chloroflexota bacterium]|nr:anti-sigma factor [Chloroflexota bacterium]
MTHTEAQDLLAPYALGTLEPSETAQVDNHLRDCAFCARLAAEAVRVANALAYSAPYMPPPPTGAARLLASIAAADQVPAMEAPPPFRAGRRPLRLLPPRRHLSPRSGWRVPVPVAALLALALGLGGWNVFLMQHVGTYRSELAQVNARVSRQSELLFMMTSDQTVSHKLQSTDFAPQAQVRLVMDPVNHKGVLMATHLPPLGQGLVYQVWLSRQGTPIPACRLIMEDQDGGDCALTMVDDIATYDSAWMTVESLRGSPRPVSTGVAHAPL